jgi:DNA-binding CsgD family transcriptional regulator
MGTFGFLFEQFSPGPRNGSGGAMRVVVAERSALLVAGVSALLEARQHVVAGVERHVGDAATLAGSVGATALVAGPTAAPAPAALAPCLNEVRRAYPSLGVVVLRDVAGLPGAVVLPGPVDGATTLDLALAAVARGGVAVEPDRAAPSLTGRERQVLCLVAEGLSNLGIAQRLRLSTNTVGTHLQHVFGKLDLPEDADVNRRVLAVLAYLSW